MSRFFNRLSLLLLVNTTLAGCQFFIGVSDDLDGLTSGAESEQVQANDLGAQDEFGSAVAVDGDTMVVGATQEDPGGVDNAGAAYVFIRTNGVWVQQVKLVASDATRDSAFGASVAIDGNTAVVGAPGAAASSGKAYIFERTGAVWVETAKLVGQPQLANTVFGTSVEISGARVIVGSPLSSSAYVFERASGDWPLEQKLFTNESGTRFGQSVAIIGNTAVVGATKDGSAGAEAGAAFVFAFTNDLWEVEATLTVGVGVRTDEFGSSVTLDGETVIVGARFRDDAGDNAGAAYVFTRDESAWQQQAKLLAIGGQPADEFGASVSLKGDMALVGAPGSNLEGEDFGAAHLFAREGEIWTEVDQLQDSAPSKAAGFGKQVALERGVAIVGSPNDNDGAQDAGSVTSFSF